MFYSKIALPEFLDRTVYGTWGPYRTRVICGYALYRDALYRGSTVLQIKEVQMTRLHCLAVSERNKNLRSSARIKDQLYSTSFTGSSSVRYLWHVPFTEPYLIENTYLLNNQVLNQSLWFLNYQILDQLGGWIKINLRQDNNYQIHSECNLLINS